MSTDWRAKIAYFILDYSVISTLVSYKTCLKPMQNTAVCTATTPEVQDALDVNVLGKLGTYMLMLQRIPLMIFKGKGYFESYQCI